MYRSTRRRRLIALSSAAVVMVIGFVTLITIDRLRGYLLTNEEGYLAPYRSGRAAIGADTAAMRGLTTDNPAQQRRLDALHSLVVAKLDELERTIGFQRSGQTSAAIAMVRTDSGKTAMDSIRRVMAAITNEERALYERRDDASQRWFALVVVTIVLGTFASAAIAYYTNRIFARVTSCSRFS